MMKLMDVLVKLGLVDIEIYWKLGKRWRDNNEG